jgi:hypothetical protein
MVAFFWFSQNKVLHLLRIKIYLSMKKTVFVLAMMALVSCGGSSETATVADSTVVVDSTVVADSVVVDSASVGDATQNAGDIQSAGGTQDGSEVK